MARTAISEAASYIGQWIPLAQEGQSAAEYCAEKSLEPGNWWAWPGGLAASLWTPDTWDFTALTLAGGLKDSATIKASTAARASACPKAAEELVKNAKLRPNQLLPKYDGPYHRLPAVVVDQISERGVASMEMGAAGTWYTVGRMSGSINGSSGTFEWYVDGAG